MVPPLLTLAAPAPASLLVRRLQRLEVAEQNLLVVSVRLEEDDGGGGAEPGDGGLVVLLVLPVFGHALLSLPPGELERLRLMMASAASLASVLTKSRALSPVRVGSCHFRIAVAAAALVLVVVTVVLLVVASAPHVEAV